MQITHIIHVAIVKQVFFFQMHIEVNFFSTIYFSKNSLQSTFGKKILNDHYTNYMPNLQHFHALFCIETTQTPL